jgi:hypothetical protein
VETGLTRIAAVFALAIACSGKRTTPVPPGSGSAEPGSAVVVDAAPVTTGPPVAIGDRAAADANVGKVVEVRGTAKNAKLAAVVMAGDLVVYCLGVDSWPTKLTNGEVTARGKLEHTDEFAADLGTAGTAGKVYVLRACAYEPH